MTEIRCAVISGEGVNQLSRVIEMFYILMEYRFVKVHFQNDQTIQGRPALFNVCKLHISNNRHSIKNFSTSRGKIQRNSNQKWNTCQRPKKKETKLKKDKQEICNKNTSNISVTIINVYRLTSQNTKDRLPPYKCLENATIWCLLQ